MYSTHDITVLKGQCSWLSTCSCIPVITSLTSHIRLKWQKPEKIQCNEIYHRISEREWFPHCSLIMTRLDITSTIVSRILYFSREIKQTWTKKAFSHSVRKTGWSNRKDMAKAVIQHKVPCTGTWASQPALWLYKGWYFIVFIKLWDQNRTWIMKMMYSL